MKKLIYKQTTAETCKGCVFHIENSPACLLILIEQLSKTQTNLNCIKDDKVFHFILEEVN